mmetsp:Transcript_34049/g.109363  ORF Transcript_34049/g.109363 Transcript_34049/m.109363 type:complete len:220 (+) Transcript_34049:38-697(+)
MARMLNNPWIEKAVMAAPNAAVQPHYVQVLDLCARQDGAQNCVLSDGARSIGAVLDASCVAAFEQTNVLERLQGAIILPGKEEYQIMVNNVLGQFNMRVLAFRYEGADDSDVLGAPRSVMEAPAVRDKFAALRHGCARPPAEGRGAASREAASQQAPQEALVRRVARATPKGCAAFPVDPDPPHLPLERLLHLPPGGTAHLAALVAEATRRGGRGVAEK